MADIITMHRFSVLFILFIAFTVVGGGCKANTSNVTPDSSSMAEESGNGPIGEDNAIAEDQSSSGPASDIDLEAEKNELDDALDDLESELDDLEGSEDDTDLIPEL